MMSPDRQLDHYLKHTVLPEIREYSEGPLIEHALPQKERLPRVISILLEIEVEDLEEQFLDHLSDSILTIISDWYILPGKLVSELLGSGDSFSWGNDVDIFNDFVPESMLKFLRNRTSDWLKILGNDRSGLGLVDKMAARDMFYPRPYSNLRRELFKIGAKRYERYYNQFISQIG